MERGTKTALVTGATSGIGRVTARELAKKGFRVVLACRNQGASGALAEELRSAAPGAAVETVRLDLSSFSSTRDCAAEVLDRFAPLDVLVNNAGTYSQGDTVTGDGIHPSLQVNYFSPFLLTGLLLPALRASGRGRIVSLSSAMYRLGRLGLGGPAFTRRTNGFSAYAGSKLAVILWSIELAERLEGTGAVANAVHPGLVDTKIMTLHKWYDVFIRAYMDRRAVGVEEGARTSVWAASSEEAGGMSGRYLVDCAPAPVRLSRALLSLRGELWERSAELVGLGGV